jgi:hypothetical protein
MKSLIIKLNKALEELRVLAGDRPLSERIDTPANNAFHLISGVIIALTFISSRPGLCEKCGN